MVGAGHCMGLECFKKYWKLIAYIGSQDLEGLGNVPSSRLWHSLDLGAWAVGDGQGGSLGDRVSRRALDNSGGDWAVSSVGSNGLGGRDTDGREPGGIARWGDVGVRVSGWGWQDWLAGNVGAGATIDEVSNEHWIRQRIRTQ